MLASFYNDAEPVVMWLTIAVVCALVFAGLVLAVIYLILKSQKKESEEKLGKIFSSYVKYAFIGFVFYALVIGILMVVAKLVKCTDSAYLDKNYVSTEVIGYVLVPLIVAMGVAIICGVAVFVLSKKLQDKKLYKTLCAILGGVTLAGVVCALVTIGIYFSKHIQNDGYYDGNYGDVNQIVLYASAAALIIVAIVAAFLLDRNNKTTFDSRCIALAGITVALSFALSYIKLWEMPQGGSVTFASLLPIMLFAYIYGPKKGVLVGFVYGLLQAIQDPYIIHPAQFLLDYPVAFSMIGFTGVFANIKALDKLPQVKFACGAILAVALRFFAHVLSGVFAFNAYALDAGENAWIYSLAYNSFAFVDLVFDVVAGVLLLSSKSFNKQVSLYATAKVKSQPATEQAATEQPATESEKA
jgi:thiamine transporter